MIIRSTAKDFSLKLSALHKWSREQVSIINLCAKAGANIVFKDVALRILDVVTESSLVGVERRHSMSAGVVGSVYTTVSARKD